MADSWITVLAQPILNFIPLRCQEVQDALDSILLREHLMMLLLLPFLIIVHKVCFLGQFGLKWPKLLLYCNLFLQIAPVGENDLTILVLTKIERVVCALRLIGLQQVGHLMKDTETDIVVWLNALIPLGNRVSKRLKVHTNHGSLDFDRSFEKFEFFRVFLFREENILKHFTFVLELISSFALFWDMLQEV